MWKRSYSGSRAHGRRFAPTGRALLCLCLLLCFSAASLSAQSSIAGKLPTSNQNSQSTDSLLQALSTDSLQAIDQLAQNLNSRNEILQTLSKLSPEQLQYLKVALPLIVNLSPFLTKTESYLNASATILPLVYDLLKKDSAGKSEELRQARILNWSLGGALVVSLIGLGYFIAH